MAIWLFAKTVMGMDSLLHTNILTMMNQPHLTYGILDGNVSAVMDMAILS